MQGFSLLGGMEGVPSPVESPPPHQAKICSPPPLPAGEIPPPPSTHTPPNQIFISFPPKINPPTKKNFLNYNPIKTSFLAVVIAPVPFMFLVSYSFDTQVMLILILIEVQYSQNAVLSFEKSLNHQNHSSGSHQPLPSPPQAKFLIPAPLPLGGFTPTTTSYCYLENPGYKWLIARVILCLIWRILRFRV